MSKARTLANLISDNAELADGQISVAEVVGAAPTANPTFTGVVGATTISSPTLNATINLKTTDANGEGIGLGIDADKKVRFYDDQGASTKMYWNASTATQKFEDSSKIAFGSSEDLKIYHSQITGNNIDLSSSPLQIKQLGANSVTQFHKNSTGHGPLLQFFNNGASHGSINTDNNQFILSADGELLIRSGGGSLKLATTSTGIAVTGGFTATDGSTITTSDNTPQLTLISTDADANSGPLLVLDRNSASPADGDSIGTISFNAKNDAAEAHGYAKIEARIVDASNATEDGRLELMTSVATEEGISRILMDATETVINDNSKNLDFRVESDGADYAFFVDGGTNNIGIQSGTSWSLSGGGSASSGSGVSIDMSYDGTIYAGSAYWAGGLKTGTGFFSDASGDRYKRSSRQATQIRQSSQGGNIQFRSQTSGTAGAVISWHEMADFGRNEVVFNDGGLDQDFRVKSDNNANMLVVDGGNDRVGVGTAGPDSVMHVYGDFKATYYRPLNSTTQTSSASLNFWKLGRIYLIGERAAEIVLHGSKHGYGTGGNIVGKTTILLRGGTSSTALDGIFYSEGQTSAASPPEVRYVNVGTDSFDIYVRHSAYSSLAHTVTTGGSWTPSLSNTGTGSAPSNSVAILPQRSLWLGSYEVLKQNQTETVFNVSRGLTDFRVASGANNHMLFVDSGNDSISIGTSTSTSDTFLRIAGSGSKYSVKYNNAYGGGTAIYANNTNAQGWIYARFNTNASQVGYISVGTTGTSYVTSSDYRLKENVVYEWDATTRLKQLKPARFNFIADADTTVDGFLAHEAQAVVPEAISGTKDAVDADGNPEYQGIDQSKLVPLLVKTIQELEARITALENA